MHEISNYLLLCKLKMEYLFSINIYIKTLKSHKSNNNMCGIVGYLGGTSIPNFD